MSKRTDARQRPWGEQTGLVWRRNATAVWDIAAFPLPHYQGLADFQALTGGNGGRGGEPAGRLLHRSISSREVFLYSK